MTDNHILKRAVHISLAPKAFQYDRVMQTRTARRKNSAYPCTCWRYAGQPWRDRYWSHCRCCAPKDVYTSNSLKRTILKRPGDYCTVCSNLSRVVITLEICCKSSKPRTRALGKHSSTYCFGLSGLLICPPIV